MNNRQKKKLYKQTLIKVRKLHPQKGDVILFQFDPEHIDVGTVVDYFESCCESDILGEASLAMLPLNIKVLSKEIAQMYIDKLQNIVDEMGE